MPEQIEANIRLFYMYRFLSSSALWGPVIVVFLVQRNFTLFQVALGDVVYWIIIILFEVPTGVIADKYSRKYSMAIGLAFLSAALFIYSRIATLAVLLFCHVVWGIGTTFISGADVALLYDSLKEMKREDEFSRIMGNAASISFASVGVSCLIGGFIATVDIVLPFVLSSIMYAAACIFVLFLIEPHLEKRSESYLLHTKESVQFLKKKQYLFTLIMLFSGLFCTYTIVSILRQPYLLALKTPLKFFGVLYLASLLIKAVGAKLAYKIEPFFGEKRNLLMISAVTAASFLLAGVLKSYVGLAVLMGSTFVLGYLSPIFDSYMNKRIPSAKRATIFSFRGMISTFFIAPLEPLFGRIADKHTVFFSHFLVGILSIGFFSVIMIRILKIKDEYYEEKEKEREKEE